MLTLAKDLGTIVANQEHQQKLLENLDRNQDTHIAETRQDILQLEKKIDGYIRQSKEKHDKVILSGLTDLFHTRSARYIAIAVAIILVINAFAALGVAGDKIADIIHNWGMKAIESVSDTIPNG
ncbi:MAG: hypothetical protein GDA50_07185 [Alphaproteobacteria bacterium GM202ARS2]|nr:hypothetical protein [Alphaproteobacteria bacterium GM202ARS2]